MVIVAKRALINLFLLFVMVSTGFNVFAAEANSKKLNWQACYQETGWNYQCASVAVPLNHQRVNYKRGAGSHEMIEIAMVRLPASEPKNHLGSLFLNPGGPGGSGIDLILGVGPWFLTDEVRAKYDLIGFDPRGIGQSHPLRCFNSEEEIQPLYDMPLFPSTYAEEQDFISFARKAVSYCKARGGEILNHMTTADVARDLDLMRQAVGDKKLYYYGFSYGSYLGTTYANLFPDKVGAIVVDAALDPIAWATGRQGEQDYLPVMPRIGSDKGAADTLQEFFRLCDLAALEDCPLAGQAETRFYALVDKIKESPLPVQTDQGDIISFTHDLLNVIVLQSMYNSDSWIPLSWLIYYLELGAPAEPTGVQYRALLETLGKSADEDEAAPIEQIVEDFFGVMCTDTDNPNDSFFWSQTADHAELENGYFGRAWTWNSIYCEQLGPSRKARYAGPFNRYTNNPVLVINSYFDPATSYEGALELDNVLVNSYFLPVAGWGHGSAFSSYCVALTASRYILSGELPEAGLVCPQDIAPFNLPYDLAITDAIPPAFAGSELNRLQLSRTAVPPTDNRNMRKKLMKSILPKRGGRYF